MENLETDLGKQQYKRTRFFGFAVFGAIVYCMLSLLSFYLLAKSFGGTGGPIIPVFALTISILHGFIFTVVVLSKKDLFLTGSRPLIISISWVVCSVIDLVALFFAGTKLHKILPLVIVIIMNMALYSCYSFWNAFRPYVLTESMDFSDMNPRTEGEPLDHSVHYMYPNQYPIYSMNQMYPVASENQNDFYGQMGYVMSPLPYHTYAQPMQSSTNVETEEIQTEPSGLSLNQA